MDNITDSLTNLIGEINLRNPNVLIGIAIMILVIAIWWHVSSSSSRAERERERLQKEKAKEIKAWAEGPIERPLSVRPHTPDPKKEREWKDVDDAGDESRKVAVGESGNIGGPGSNPASGSGPEPAPALGPTNTLKTVDVGNYPIKELFDNKWMFLIDVDEAQKEYNFDAEPLNYMEFTKSGPFGRASVKISSESSSGERELHYRVDGNTLYLSEFRSMGEGVKGMEMVDLFAIDVKKGKIRLLEVEKKVTKGAKFECKFQKVSP